MMRILMILEGEFPPDIRVENEIETLLKLGFEVHIFCTIKTNRKASESEVKGNLFIHRAKMNTFTYKSSIGALKFPFYFNFFRKHLKQLIKKYKFDVIHVHDLPLAKVGYELKCVINAKMILDLHENYPDYLVAATHTKKLLARVLCSISQWRKYEIRYANLADYIITIVEEAGQRLEKLNISKEKIHIVPNTFNPDNFISVHSGNKSTNKLVLFYGGGINRNRGLQDVIKAMSKTKRNDSILLIVGKGSYLNKLKILTSQLNLDDRIKFLGWKNQIELLNILPTTDAALIPHKKSVQTDCSSPNKLYQYMYYNLPIIASDCKSIRRIIDETKSGFIFETIHQLTILIDTISENKDILNDYKNGRYFVENKYNWRNTSKPMNDIYKLIEKNQN